MACSNTTTKIWFVNPGAIYDPNNSCQSLFIPVEAIAKQSPAATASVGVPFTYTLTIPVMYDPATGTWYNNASPNYLGNIRVTDDLTAAATGAEMTLVGINAYIKGSGAPVPITNNGDNKHLDFTLPDIAAGSQVVVEITVVLDNTPTNTAGKQFINTAPWQFSRLIDGVLYSPLPGQSGVSSPMIIADPDLTLTKTGSAQTVNLTSQVKYTLDVQNNSGADAWNATITDNLPAGMSAYSPLSTVTARIFAADGVSPVSASLVKDTDFTLTWSGGSGSPGQLNLAMLDTTKIGPNQHLIISYQAQVDSTGVAPGTTLTNIAGATRWFSASSTSIVRREYDKTITDGTPGTKDFQDAWSVTAAQTGYYFQKTVRDLTTGTNQATTAFPGDKLRYTLLLQNFTWPALNGITITDSLPAGLGSISNVTITPAGGSTSVTSNSITITGLDLPGGATTNSQIQIDFDATLDSNLTNGTVISNQANLTGTDALGKTWTGPSDDPSVNGAVLLGQGGDPTRLTIQAPGALSKANNQSTATIGQQFSYTIKVPVTPTNVPLYDVKILDNLALSAANMTFVGAQATISGVTRNLTNTGTPTNIVLQDLNSGIDIPAGAQAEILVTVALQNTTTNHSGLTYSNTASYTYDKLSGDSATQANGGAATTSAMTVVEPHLAVAKIVDYASPAGKSISSPAAPGDVLRYTVTIRNDGSSEAYDTDLLDYLPTNVTLIPNSATAQINGIPVSGFKSNPTSVSGGALAWGSQNGDTNLDIPTGGTLVITYQVSVLQTTGAPVTNHAYVDWTSLSGSIAGERSGAGCPNVTAPNNYCSGPASAAVSSIDPTTFTKSVVSDSWTTAPSTGTDSTLRIGDTVLYNLALTLREGVTQNIMVTDQLPAGLAFDGVVSITPAPGSSNFTYAVASQPAPGSTGTLTWNLGNVTNVVDNNPANNTLIIQYRAHVVRDILAQSPTAQQLANNATLSYAIDGFAATPKTANATVNIWQPMLNVSKSAVTANGNTVITAGEPVTYTVKIANSGAAPAYNTILADTLPVGMRQAGVSTSSIILVNTVTNAVTATLPTLAPTYSSVTGVATWNFDTAGSSALYAIPPGQTLQVVYQVKTDSGLGAGMTLNNQARVTNYYSFDSQDVPASSVVTNRQAYGPTSTAAVQLTSASATALSKQALVATAAIGQPFAYQIRIPATPQPTAMYDVRILDDLRSSVTGVDLSFVSVQRVSGPSFTPVNTGTATNLIIQDTVNGIDIPAGQQIVVNVTVILANSAVNTLGKQFQNTATYTYDSVNNTAATQANGAPGASPAITIVGPALNMQKSGPATISALAPGTFTLNVQNTGGSTAWQATLTDILPNVSSPSPGSMCGSAPTNVTARIYQADGVTPVSASLVNGTDFIVSFAGAPACTFTVAMKSSAAAIPPTDRLIVTYSASLDPNTAGGITLTNVAAATRWLSADPAVTAPGNIQTFTAPLTNGTPGVLDNQDAFTVTTLAPLLTFDKTVYNATTGQSGANARPGDTLQYTFKIQNIGSLAASNFTLTDELDKLNPSAMFASGTLKILSVPAGANTSLTTPSGGTKGTGLVNIGNLSVAPQGQAGDSLVIQFQVTLAPVINSGTLVLNQAQIGSNLMPTQSSDDPSITGAANPTQTLITSSPVFQVLKTVQDITSGTATFMAGDTLRYTITVKNIGTENATGVTLRDLIPANTSYVANSTMLNGKAVADLSAGVSILQNGLPINSPADLTAGAMPATAGTATNMATVTFQVVVSRNVVAGTLISNQGFVNGSGAGSGPFVEQPSDNPATPVPNDPTTVVVGNLPLVYALKTVQLAGDVNGNGLVDPGDTLQYTITLTNSGATQASGVILTDAIPTGTTYVANSVQMNGVAIADSTPGISPLANGIGVVSAGITPPSPPSYGGTLAAGGTGVVSFKVQVDSGVGSATIISNQGSVATTQLPVLLTDADGNSTNGYQPTVIVVGNTQQLSITKSAVVVGGGAALPGSALEYTIQATNIGQVPATNVVITDDLTPLLAQATYVNGSATMNGSVKGVSFTSPVVTANYGATYGTLSSGSSVILRFRVILKTVASGSVITNTGQAAWNTPVQTANASTSVTAGGMPGSASLNGLVWQDANFNNSQDSGELSLAGWTVDLYQNGGLVGTLTTDADGAYHFSGVTPNAGTSITYELRFRAPGAGASTAMLGWCSSQFTNGLQRISNIVAGSGGFLQDLDLPLTPNGVVYNSIMRTPVAGATLTMVQASSNLPVASSCFNDPTQQGQVTTSSGYYKFDLNFSDPSCPTGVDYLIQVTPPASGYLSGVSRLVPAAFSTATTSFSVPDCPGSAADAVPTTSNYCEAQVSALAPVISVPAGTGTAYYLRLTLNNLQPGYGQIYNNHLPIDPTLDTAIAITKTAALVDVTKSQLVPYTITLKNTLGVTLQNLSVVDTFPLGFKYVAGSARLDKLKIEPVMNNRQLIWNISQLSSSTTHTITFLMIVGSGVSEGEYVNRAQVMDNATGTIASGVAAATVRVIADPDLDCTDIIGKVFDDTNANGNQDAGEKGLPGVRTVTARGLIATTDEYGRFHIICAVVPDEDRGSNFILKLDDRTLPTGYRVTSENPQVQRATRGKMLRYNFGATIHHVVSMDIADGVFEPGTTKLRMQWQPRIDLLLKELRKAPSVLRLSYLAENESRGLVDDRLKALKKEITGKWDGGYQLTIETEVFWRRGSPP
ncbi:isopeptide-forming domain-containing fimbrial protein [Geotalea sp. SG265]|uniref:isopeptide-forming domain-containing fimbrial protein n=1 Tax=Geotalea sp. SG265 TaxID=2922867 RepID=UPI001FB04512|nr:isopeptide-forming domain-containing fimbrial protein [Geotalea sp. SG265]